MTAVGADLGEQPLADHAVEHRSAVHWPVPLAAERLDLGPGDPIEIGDDTEDRDLLGRGLDGLLDRGQAPDHLAGRAGERPEPDDAAVVGEGVADRAQPFGHPLQVLPHRRDGDVQGGGEIGQAGLVAGEQAGAEGGDQVLLEPERKPLGIVAAAGGSRPSAARSFA